MINGVRRSEINKYTVIDVMMPIIAGIVTNSASRNENFLCGEVMF